jgi:hypothetical protein
LTNEKNEKSFEFGGGGQEAEGAAGNLREEELGFLIKNDEFVK